MNFLKFSCQAVFGLFQTPENRTKRPALRQAFFCAKPKNSVPDFQKLSSPKFQKTQFLAKKLSFKPLKN